MDKVLLVLGDAAEVLDTMIPYYRLGEEFEVVLAGPEKRTYHLVQHDRHPDWDITVESPGYLLAVDLAFRDVKTSDYLALVVTGGRAPEYLRYDQDLLRLTREFFRDNKPIATVCHGVEIVAAAGTIKGRTLTTVAKCKLDIEQVGGRYVDEPVVVDDNLVSARTWHDSSEWMRRFVPLVRAEAKRSGSGREASLAR